MIVNVNRTFVWYFEYFCLRFMINIFLEFIHTEAVVQRCSVKKVFLKISQNSQENTCVGVSFLQVLGLQLYEKRDSNTGVFLWILRNF